jgi:hypothetical protein
MRFRATATVALALLAACGGGGGDEDAGGDDVATLEEASVGGDDTTTTTLDEEEAWLAFARCMRENGAEWFPDPGPEGMQFLLEPGQEASFREADEVCGHLTPSMAMSDEDRSKAEEAFRALARCLRDRGWDVPDPEITTPGDGGVQVSQEPPDGVDPDDPEFEADRRECGEEAGVDDGPASQAQVGG